MRVPIYLFRARHPALVAGKITRGKLMQAEIHPKYAAITAKCSCGNVVETRSSLCRDINLDVCSQCHPFYTGRQKVAETGGRVDRFKQRFGSRSLKR